MLTCPFCRAEVSDDSRFCDQCGKEFFFCPECGKPRRGTMCAVCGAGLVKAEAFFGGADRSGSPAAAVSSEIMLALSGEGLSLALREGDFGRRGGIWPDLSTFQYISGTHGHIGRQGDLWTITDLGSTNGTTVNGKPLTRNVPCPIKAGDNIGIATSNFVVKIIQKGQVR
ncbi:MAG: FHA domain-containing protein [Bacteroidales bacterium]|nr:FHA domain-containing protein [Bacteroidales bacterium]